MQSIKERIEKAIAYLKGEQIVNSNQEIIDLMRVNKSSFSQAINGNEKYLTEGFILKFCAAYPVFNKDWLWEGKGEMLKQHTPPDRDIPRSEERGGEILSLEIIKKLLDEREKERADWQENIKRLEERISMLEKEVEDKGTSIPDKEMPLSRT